MEFVSAKQRWPSLKIRLARSSFRSRFRLDPKEFAYLADKGDEIIRRHGEDFIRNRLAPASPKNDGRQTPMRGHPVFTAQHATATCCRSCLAKWHGIPKGAPLTDAEINYIVEIIMAWIGEQTTDGQGTLIPQ
ncbi:MAG: DUF4186 domain-containing protein [Deltaproteobacteria bacterium]|nr:DUF4186 domain-containing protein [Deltaproteobacteria bacterium]